MTAHVKVEQDIFYFTHEEVREALRAAVINRVPPENQFYCRISAGLNGDSGLTLCFQKQTEVRSEGGGT